MSVAVLTILKLVLLVLLYIFIYRAVRTIVADLYGPRRRRARSTPRSASAQPADAGAKRSRRPPRELVVHPPDGKPTVVQLNRERVTIGRSDRVTVPVNDVYVSDEHALIAEDEGSWTVRDLGSTNGTYLNGAKVTQPTPLAAGDQVRIGKTRIEVRR
jgi:pSer/pThr/pTyr-binding forkhead associated (FHA) protein